MAETDFTEHSDAELNHAATELENSLRQLANLRQSVRTPEDGEDGYKAVIKHANQIICDGLLHLAETCRRMGENARLQLPATFTQALWILEDDAGEQTFLKKVKALEYGMSRAEYEEERNQKRTRIAEIKRELARRQADAKSAEAERIYQTELQRIGE